MRFKGAMRHCKSNLPLHWTPICHGEHASKGLKKLTKIKNIENRATRIKIK